jgi:hypothetical protein
MESLAVKVPAALSRELNTKGKKKKAPGSPGAFGSLGPAMNDLLNFVSGFPMNL